VKHLDAPQLLSDLRAAGFTLTRRVSSKPCARELHLVVDLIVSPASKLSKEQADLIRHYREDLLTLLRKEEPQFDHCLMSDALTVEGPHVGWAREDGRPWKEVCRKSSYSAAWDTLLTLPALTNHRELIVLPLGRKP
jgi:hypothetical protein